MENVPNGFFAYPSEPPAIGEAITSAVTEINKSGTAKIKTWQEMRGEGLILIDKICEEIDSASIFFADLTNLNPNVLFEFGYAVAKDKKIWPIFDDTIVDSQKRIQEFETLTTIGYSTYTNSEDIVHKYYDKRPYEHIEDTIFKRSIEQNLIPNSEPHLLYLKSQHSDEASLKLNKLIEKKKISKTISDPREVATRSITWYAANIERSSGVICHLTHTDRTGAVLANSIYTLVAGMAHGFNKELLMLIDDSSGRYFAPLDFRNILKKYKKGTDAESIVNDWIVPIENEVHKRITTQLSNNRDRKLVTELKELQFGDPLAENEAETIDKYFVETASYKEALRGNYLIFVGRKGAGKTANLLKLSHALKSSQNLICTIRPVGYELLSLLNFLRKHTEFNSGHGVESLWKFLIYSEVAKSLVELINSRPAQSINDDEQELISLVTTSYGEIEDFDVRLDRCIKDLLEQQKSNSLTAHKVNLSEALHVGTLRKLRKILPRVLGDKRRVVILIDNLDKAWDKKEDIEDLSDFLLALLNASEHILTDLKRDLSLSQINVNLTIFLRSDIFHKILEIAPEPDKIKYSRLSWKDRDQLIRVIEERFIASHNDSVSADELWEKYFCPEVNGIPTAEYLTGRILPRPRDLVLFVALAVSEAINHRHTKVEEQDIIAAEKECSKNAITSLLVETSKIVEEMEDILYEFTGSEPVINHTYVTELINREKGSAKSTDEVLNVLLETNFLGLEVNEGDFRFPEDPQELKKNKFQARNLARRTNGEAQYQIHPAFWAYLETDTTNY